VAAVDAEEGAVAAEVSGDRFGVTWRPELATGILANIDRIDVVEIVAEDCFGAPRRVLRALRTLARQVDVVIHGVGLGAASTARVERRRLEALARLVGEVEPVFWSEHLAFVRAGDIEIGHLAAPPRTRHTADGAAANLTAARAIVGSAPLVENIATLIDPPASDMSEAEWIAAVVGDSGSDLLLDLHNLHANSTNFGYDPVAFLDTFDAGRIGAIHLAGGKWIDEPAPKEEARAFQASDDRAPRRRILDDHLHDVPDPVYALLAEVGSRQPRPLSVILERDGAFPAIEDLLAQLDRARAALAQGRQHATAMAPFV
jgi:uncharacterized protein (UPF0276 family)